MDEWIPASHRWSPMFVRHRSSSAYILRRVVDTQWHPYEPQRWYVVKRPSIHEPVLAGPFTLKAAKVWVLARLYAESKL